jgi:LCP family protein required for cell wall assembly
VKIKVFVFAVLCLFCAVTVFGFASHHISSVATASDSSSATVLFLGVDSAAENSDVVAVGRFDGKEKQLTLMQLPRDMYMEWEDNTPKLNHIYAACRAKGLSKQEALAQAAHAVEQALSVPIDMAVCLNLSAFAALVDAIGGIPMDIPFDMYYQDPSQNLSILLKAGKTVLDGKTAEQFVRYRSGYIEGDLGRVDAQKLFLAASLRHVLQSMTVKDALSVFLLHRDGIVLLDEQHQLFSVLGELFSARRDMTFHFLSIPGQAICTANTWYYVINRDATCEALNRYFAPPFVLDAETFDRGGRLYNEDESISDIYFSTAISYRAYSADEISDINILIKD